LDSKGISVNHECSITQPGERTDRRASQNDAELFGDLFAIWTQDRADLWDWGDAPEFAAIVHAYSDWSLSVVAV